VTTAQGLALAAAYLLGAIPVGLLIGLSRGVDVRTVGSGNIGATNVLRALGIGFGLLVFAVDVLKGVAAVLLCRWVGLEGWLLAMGAFFAVLGHSFSPYLAFKGGKGVATSLGTFLALEPVGAVIAFAVWFAIVLPTRYVSLGSVIAVAAAPVIFFALRPAAPEALVPVVALALLVIGRHNENIERLLRGEENRFGRSRSRTPQPGEATDAAEN